MLIIVNWLIKTVYYELVKITINVLSLEKDISNIVIQNYCILNSIIRDWSLVFISKFSHSYTTFLVLSANFLLLSIYKLIIRLNIKIV